jgi:hypothetical protein
MNKETRYSIKTKSSFNVKLKGNEGDWSHFSECRSYSDWNKIMIYIHLPSWTINLEWSIKEKFEFQMLHEARINWRHSLCVFQLVFLGQRLDQNSSKVRSEFVESSIRIRRIFDQNSEFIEYQTQPFELVNQIRNETVVMIIGREISYQYLALSPNCEKLFFFTIFRYMKH